MFAKYLSASAVLVALLFTASCKKDSTSPSSTAPVAVSATLNAAQQVPVTKDSTIHSAATGTMVGSYDPSTKQLSYTITYQGFAAGKGPTAGHFHIGVASVNGNNFFTLPNVGTSPITGTATFTQAQADALLSQGVYVNLHTARYPNGEIRGNINK